jgi:very-short-patch-repair endonuclease
MPRVSELEASFETYWQMFAPPYIELRCEVLFAPPRKYRFDFAHMASLTAIELEGGVWSGGRHTRPKGFEDDCQKYNLATCEGWAVLRYTGKMLNKDPQGVICEIVELIAIRTPF